MKTPSTYPFMDDAPAATPYAPAKEGQLTVYRGACLIDGTAAPAGRDMAVVVEGPRIKTIAPATALPQAAFPGAEVIDLHGAYVLPGLIDSHQHLATPPNRAVAETLLERQIYSGVTAVRDMADDLRQMADLSRAATVGEIAGPDIYYAALMAGPTFFSDPRTIQVSQGAIPGAVPWMQAIDRDTDLAIAMAMARGTYASAIKVYADLDGPTVARLVAEAHRQHLPVWSHAAVFPAMPFEVVTSGMDSVSHAEMLVYHVTDPRPKTYGGQHRPPAYRQFLAAPADCLDGLLEEMRRRGTILDATASMSSRPFPGRDVESAVLSREVARRIVARAARAGVAICAGTDYETPYDDPFPSLFEEIRFLVEDAGMATSDALRSATAIGARAIGQEAAMGSLEVGKLANFVVLADDPRARIGNLRSIWFTVKRGHRYDRAEYLARRAQKAAELTRDGSKTRGEA